MNTQTKYWCRTCREFKPADQMLAGVKFQGLVTGNCKPCAESGKLEARWSKIEDEINKKHSQTNKMNILEHPIHKDIYDLYQEIDKLPASEHAAECVGVASNLEKEAVKLVNEAAKLVGIVREIKRIALKMMPQQREINLTVHMMPKSQYNDLAHIINLCTDAGITDNLDAPNPK